MKNFWKDFFDFQIYVLKMFITILPLILLFFLLVCAVHELLHKFDARL